MRFTVHATPAGTRARGATLVTAHGAIATPTFMPVGTRGTVRTQTLPQLRALTPILLANTYHLLSRPGPEALARFGGLHAWMKWPGAILTDSGGFQIFSLGATLDERGAVLRLGGERHDLTPERSIAVQLAIGSDIMMVLDHCIASTAGEAEARAAMELTTRWARRSLAARGEAANVLFAIVQGACFPALRRESGRALAEIVEAGRGFDGFAIGGLAVGEGRAERQDTTEIATEVMPVDRPRYLMGVGTPLDLLEGVHRGVDMFDCVLPTSMAQQGVAFTSHGRVDLRRGTYKESGAPLDAACRCEACTTYERSYLHHLVRCKEPLGWQLLANHNLTFYTGLMSEIRTHIDAGTFAQFHAVQRALLGEPDRDNPPVAPPRRAPKRPERRGAFALVTSPQGFTSVAHVASGEVMHSVSAPDDEAERIYVAQSRWVARGGPLVAWDVGLGAAHNAMALVRAAEARGLEVELVSFERDLDALELALANLPRFPHLRHEAPHRLAREGHFERGGLRWTLVRGDVRETLDHVAPGAQVVFFDPFSAKVDTPLWQLETLRRLRARLAPGAELFTYTTSTAIRAAFLAAGFQVARGVGSGPKTETTIALVAPPIAADYDLLGAEWLDRRSRSSAPHPAGWTPDDEATIAAHPQFTAGRDRR